MKIKQNNQTGFTAVEVLLVILVLAVIGFGGYYVWHTQHNKTVATNDSSKSSANTKTNSTSSSSSNPYAGWKAYTLPVEKISFMYPSDWTLSDADSTTTSDTIALTYSDGSQFVIEDGIPNGGDGIPEAPSSYDIPVTFLGGSDYLALIYGEGSVGQGSSDGLINGVTLSTSTNEYGGVNGGYALPTDKYAEGSSTNFGQGVEANFMSVFLTLKKQITLQQVSSSADIKTAELVIASMHY